MKQSILIVEDDERMNEIINDYFIKDGYTTYQAYDGIEAMKIFDKSDIDLVILDIMIPGIDGWSVCRRIRKQSNTLIIILSARSDEDDKLMGFELGADEYVTKPFSPKVLVARVEALIKRSSILSIDTRLQNIGLIQINRETRELIVASDIITLTAKEFDLLVLFIDHEKKVFSRDTIIDQLWGYDYVGDGRVVDTNIKTLRKKLKSASKYIHTIIGIGYKFEVTL